MKYRTFCFAVFPVVLLSLLLAERLMVILLGLFPSVATFWQAFIGLRGMFRDLSNGLQFISGYSFLIEISVLVLCVVLVCMLACAQRSVKTLFLVNHFALILSAGAMIVAANPVVASSGSAGFFTDAGYWSIFNGIEWSQAMILTIGLLACVFCHVVYLGDSRIRRNEIALFTRMLRYDL